MCVVHDENTGKKWCDKLVDQYLVESDKRYERVVAGMPWSHVNETVSRLQTPIKRRVCEIRVPASSGAKVVLPNSVANRIPDIEILGCNECDAEYLKYDDEQQKEMLKKNEEIKFYRGQPPTWWNFWFRTQVCEREIHNELRRKVEQALRTSSDHDFVDRVRIYHQPGAGGTTSAMHILWTLRQSYRVGIVEHCSNRLNSKQIEKLVSQIMDFYKYEEDDLTKARPVLLLLDNPEEETEFFLLNETSERARSLHRPGDKTPVVCVFLECLRLTQMSTPDPTAKTFDRNCVCLKHKLSPGEISWFRSKGQTLQDDFDAHAPNSVNPESLISFNILKFNFSKEFMRNTVGTLVKAITNEKERTLLKYISLLNSFDLQNRAVPIAAFDEMMTEYRIVRKKVVFIRNWENKLSDAFHVLVYETKSSEGTGALCSKNALLAKESLEALRRTSDGKETVSDIALEFFKCRVFSASCKSREKLTNIVKNVLKERPRLPNGVHSDDFSPMISHIVEIESSHKAHEVLMEGYELTQDPFVAQQLARLLYIKLKNWDQAIEVIKSAIQQLPDNSYLWDTYGRIYEKRLSSEYPEYRDGSKKLTLDLLIEVIDLGLKGIKMFHEGQNASETEKTANDVGYYGELDIMCTLIDYLKCCDAFQNETEAHLRQLLLHDKFYPPDLHDLKSVNGCDYIQILKELKPRVDTILKRLQDEKIELKPDAKYMQSTVGTGSLVKLKEKLNCYFGEDPDQLPQDIPENDRCAFRRRQIFRLAGNNMHSIFDQRWKHNGEETLTKVRQKIEENISSGAVSANDYLIAVSTNLALTSINPDCWCEKIKFEDMLKWSKTLYETRQNLTIHSKTKPIYLEPYLFMTMFNWPRENTSQTFMPSEVKTAVSKWKEEFYKKYPRLNREGKWPHKREGTLFFLANGSGMESIYINKYDSPRVNEDSSEFWHREHTRKILQRFEGILEHPGMSLNYHFNGTTLNIPTSFPIEDRSWWRKRVYFVIGFSWAGPKAYDVSLEKPSNM